MTKGKSSEQDENPVKYINEVIDHLENKRKEADIHIENNEYIEAKNTLDKAFEYYQARIQDLSNYKQTLFFPSSSKKLEESKKDQELFTQISEKLISILSSLEERQVKNQPIAKAERAYKDLKKQQETASQELDNAKNNVTEQQEVLKKIREKLDEAQQAYSNVSNAEIADNAQNTPSEPVLDMQILGAFIGAIGVSAVAIAFVALNAAALTIPGVMLASFGVGAALFGGSIFSSNAKNIDEYTKDVYRSCLPSTANS